MSGMNFIVKSFCDNLKLFRATGESQTPQTLSCSRLFPRKEYIMNNIVLENFKKLSPEKQEELIAFLVRLKSYYPQGLVRLLQVENTNL